MIGTAGDDVLRWASEYQAGTWRALNEAAAHALGSRSVQSLRPWQLASDMSDLGHIDIDWEKGRWSAAPPCIVVARGMGLCAYLAGWRNSRLLKRYEDAADSLDVYPFEVRMGQAPTTVYAKCASVQAVHELAAKLEVPAVFDPASALAELVTVTEIDARPGAPPPADEDVDLFDEVTLQWVPAEPPYVDKGLYRYELHGRKTFRLRTDADWSIVDRAAGQLAMLAGRSDVIRWHPADRHNRTPRVMTVHAAVTLPPIAERAAVSASGLLPHRHQSKRIYRNVSIHLARRLAEGLGLTLHVEDEPIATWKEAK